MTKEEAIYRLNNTAWLGSNADRVATENAVQMAIEALKETQWIPCSERLPKTNGVYIVARWFGDGCEKRILSDACYFDGSDTWYDDTRLNHGREYVTHKIVAWMPLPEPYKEDNMEDNHYKMGKMLADNFYNGVSFWREYADKRWEEICKDYKGSEDKE